MKMTLQQPFFFPYLTYFDLLNRVDRWLVFDTPQYVKWISRNRILHPVSGWQYILVPVNKHARATSMRQIEIAPKPDWKGLILRQLRHYADEAPYYAQVMGFLEECFAGREKSLVQLDIRLLEKTSRRLGIETPIEVYSEMGLTLPGPIEGPGDWGVKVAQAVGADQFLSLPLPAGANHINEQMFMAKGIRLHMIPYTPLTYPCGRFVFEPNLSIIDVMMWNSPEQIKEHLDARRAAAAFDEPPARAQARLG